MASASTNLILAFVAVAVVFAIGFIGKAIRRNLRRRSAERGVHLFRLQREQLEAKFLDLARSRGKPRGLRWLQCDWQDRVSFGRAADTGLLTAFVAVNISFEAIEGGDMEDVEAVDTIRDATALFHYDPRGHWGTGGRALFNMDPDDALIRLEGQFEPVSLKY